MTHAEMTTLIDQLQKEREKELQIARTLRKRLSSAPDGKLLVACSNGRTQFYCRTGAGTGGRTYLPKKNPEALRLLVQKKYEEALLSISENNLNIWNDVISSLQKGLDPESAMLEIPVSLQPYIAAPFSSTADFVEQWLVDGKKQVGRKGEWQAGRDGQHGDWHPENLVYSTDNGERVRSKSEMMIANLLFAMRLPYQYEKPLHLNSKTVFPDFTILDTASRTEVYFEHFGLMDQEDYRAAALLKIVNYEKAGFMAGKDFLFSFESERVPFDIDWIRGKLYERFGVER